MKTNWMELLAQHEAQTAQMARGLYEAITGAETLGEIVPKEEMGDRVFVMSAHTRLMDQQNEVRERGLDYGDLLGEVMAFKAIAEQIMAEEAALCLRY